MSNSTKFCHSISKRVPEIQGGGTTLSKEFSMLCGIGLRNQYKKVNFKLTNVSSNTKIKLIYEDIIRFQENFD